MKLLFCLAIFSVLSIAANAQCKGISKKVDKFDNEITYRTPALEPVALIRVDTNGASNYYLRFMVRSQISTSRKGVFVLFDDSTKLEWPDEDVSFTYLRTMGHIATCFVQLTDSQLTQLTSKKITDFKLYIYESSLKKKDAERFLGYANCIRNISASEGAASK